MDYVLGLHTFNSGIGADGPGGITVGAEVSNDGRELVAVWVVL